MFPSGFDSLRKGWIRYPSLFLFCLGACSGAAAPPLESVVALESGAEAGPSISARAGSRALPSAPADLRPLVWERDDAEARAKAQRNGAPMLVYLRAEWAAACAEMERDVWTDVRVMQRAKDFVLLKIDVSAADLEEDLYVQRYAAHAIPSVVLYDAEGKRAAVISGRTDTEELLRAMEDVVDFGVSGPRD